MWTYKSPTFYWTCWKWIVKSSDFENIKADHSPCKSFVKFHPTKLFTWLRNSWFFVHVLNSYCSSCIFLTDSETFLSVSVTRYSYCRVAYHRLKIGYCINHLLGYTGCPNKNATNFEHFSWENREWTTLGYTL